MQGVLVGSRRLTSQVGFYEAKSEVGSRYMWSLEGRSQEKTCQGVSGGT